MRGCRVSNDEMTSRNKAELFRKWQRYLPSKPTSLNSVSHLEHQIFQVLENQEKFFSTVDTPKDVPRLFGENWRSKIYSAIAEAIYHSPVASAVSIQALSSPIDSVQHYVQQFTPGLEEEGSASVPTLQMNIAAQQLRAVPRKTVGRVNEKTWPDIRNQFKIVLQEISQEVFGTMLHASQVAGFVSEVHPIRNFNRGILTASTKVFQRSMRGTANFAVGAGKFVDRLPSNRFFTWREDALPENKILLFRKGVTPLDATMIWAPYHFTFSRIGNGTGWGINVRHAIHLVDVNHIQVVRINPECTANPSTGAT